MYAYNFPSDVANASINYKVVQKNGTKFMAP